MYEYTKERDLLSINHYNALLATFNALATVNNNIILVTGNGYFTIETSDGYTENQINDIFAVYMPYFDR